LQGFGHRCDSLLLFYWQCQAWGSEILLMGAVERDRWGARCVRSRRDGLIRLLRAEPIPHLKIEMWGTQFGGEKVRCGPPAVFASLRIYKVRGRAEALNSRTTQKGCCRCSETRRPCLDSASIPPLFLMSSAASGDKSGQIKDFLEPGQYVSTNNCLHD